MQMIITERCPFLFADCNFCSHEGKSACQPRKAGARSLEDLPSANIVRTKAKVRVSPKGWRTVFGRFAECKFSFARRQKCVSASKGWRTVFGRFAECKDKHYSRNLQTFNSLLLSLFDIYHDIVCKARAKARTLSRYLYRLKLSR